MAAENREIEEFLNNMRKALKHYSVKELNIALHNTLGKNSIGITREVNQVIIIVSKHYCISERVLKNSVSRGKIAEAKHIAYCLLHYDLGLSVGYISKRVFNCWRNSVYIGIKRIHKDINKPIKADKEFNDTYKLMQIELFKYITRTK
jgi:hypothetical protein